MTKLSALVLAATLMAGTSALAQDTGIGAGSSTAGGAASGNTSLGSTGSANMSTTGSGTGVNSSTGVRTGTGIGANINAGTSTSQPMMNGSARPGVAGRVR